MSRDTSFFNKTVLFINSGGKKKRFTLDVARRMACNIILVNSDLDVPRKLVDHFIQADNYVHREVIEKIEAFQEEHPEVSIDGAITFWEDDIPLLARVCDHFGFTGNNYQTAINTRNKYEMRKRLKETGLGSPDYHLIHNREDLEDAIDWIGFPAVMKPVWGSDSQFVVLVKDQDEVYETYDYLLKNCNEQFDPIYKYNDGMFLYEEYLEGTEISLECFSQYGIPHVIGINEKQPIKPPYFIEYGDIAPARLSEDTERECIKLAESSLIALGVQNSLSHIELKITPSGPKIIEVASRMGGDDIYLNVKTVWGQDMVKMGLQIATGQKVDYKIREPRDCVICRYFIPSFSGIITNISGVKESRELKNVIDLNITKDVGDAVLVPPEGFDSMGWIVTKGRSYQEAETVMERAIRKMEISVTRFQKNSVLGKLPNDQKSTAPLVRRELMRAARIEKIRNLDAIKKLHIGIMTNSLIPQDDQTFRRNDLGDLIKEILIERGYAKVTVFDMNESPLPIRKIQRANLDFVLNLCETILNSQRMESHGAALLDMIQVPYTGSSPATISLCLDKITVKKLFHFHEIPTPAWDYAYTMKDDIRSDLKFPLIVKPANSDNSFGISNESVVTNKADLRRQLSTIIEGFNRPALIEEFIAGDEYDVCLMGNGDEARVLPMIRSIFDRMPRGYWHIYGSDAKGDKKASVYDFIRLEKPARVTKKLGALISGIALDVYNLFDCLDYGKVEIRVDRHGNPYVLEVNPNPPIGPEDFIAVAGHLDRLNYADFLEELIFTSVQRYRQTPAYTYQQLIA